MPVHPRTDDRSQTRAQDLVRRMQEQMNGQGSVRGPDQGQVRGPDRGTVRGPDQAQETQQRRPADAATQQASRQRAMGTERERAGTQRGDALTGPQTSAARGLNTDMRRGARGPEVEALQRSLNERGARLEVDGRYGPRTERAVRDYQAANPPLQRDGVVGPRTRESLARPANETNPIGQRPGSGTGRPGGAERPGGGTTPVGGTELDRMDPRRMTAQQAAQALLRSPNVSFWNGLSSGSDRVQLERIARGENPRVPARGNREVQPNVNMLRSLVAMSREGRIQINAVTGGTHSSNSNHYRGNSVDLQPGVGLSTARIRQIAAQYGGVKNNEAHIHLTFPR